MFEAYMRFRFLTEVFGWTILICITIFWLVAMGYYYWVKPLFIKWWSKGDK